MSSRASGAEDGAPFAYYAYGGAHSSISQKYMTAILTNPKVFKPADVCVIFWYAANSPGHGVAIRKTGKQIAEEMSMTPEGFCRIVGRLRKRRVLLERDRVGVTKFYALNPYLGGRGSGYEQREAVASCLPPDIPGHDIKPADVTPALYPSRTRRTA